MSFENIDLIRRKVFNRNFFQNVDVQELQTNNRHLLINSIARLLIYFPNRPICRCTYPEQGNPIPSTAETFRPCYTLADDDDSSVQTAAHLQRHFHIIRPRIAGAVDITLWKYRARETPSGSACTAAYCVCVFVGKFCADRIGIIMEVQPYAPLSWREAGSCNKRVISNCLI